MITYFAKKCKEMLKKDTKKNMTEAEQCESAGAEYKYEESVCPNCGAKGKLKPNGSYYRHIVTYIDEKVDNKYVETRRFRCKSCKKTHALIYGVLVPYSMYTVSFKLSVLLAYYERKMTVAAICEKYRIAKSTLYKWKAQLVEQKELLLGEVVSVKTTAIRFIGDILGFERYPSELKGFYEKYGFSFLQATHSATRPVPP